MSFESTVGKVRVPTARPSATSSVVPLGLESFGALYPALKREASGGSSLRDWNVPGFVPPLSPGFGSHAGAEALRHPRSKAAGRMPCGFGDASGSAGVLRLHLSRALRATNSAQDDRFYLGSTFNIFVVSFPMTDFIWDRRSTSSSCHSSRCRSLLLLLCRVPVRRIRVLPIIRASVFCGCGRTATGCGRWQVGRPSGT